MDAFGWYATLVKPSWAPPSWLFGPVWTVLYIIIAISFGAAFVMVIRRKLKPMVLLPFVLNLMFNVAFTPLQFSLRNNYLAALDVLLVLATLVWVIVVIYPRVRWIAYAQIPYLLWVSFATVLQLTVTYLNLP